MSVNKSSAASIIQEIKCDIRIIQIDNKKITNELTCIRKLVENIILNQNKILLSNIEIKKMKTEPIKVGWLFT